MNTRKYSSSQEDYVAKLVGGTKQYNSGATLMNKGDVYTKDWLFECKTSIKRKSSFAIKQDWLLKNDLERMEMHKPYSALVFQYEPDGTNYFVIDEFTFKKMFEEFNNAGN